MSLAVCDQPVKTYETYKRKIILFIALLVGTRRQDYTNRSSPGPSRWLPGDRLPKSLPLAPLSRNQETGYIKAFLLTPLSEHQKTGCTKAFPRHYFVVPGDGLEPSLGTSVALSGDRLHKSLPLAPLRDFRRQTTYIQTSLPLALSWGTRRQTT